MSKQIQSRWDKWQWQGLPMALFWSCSSTRLTTCTTSSARWREPGWMSMIHCEPQIKDFIIHIFFIFSSIPRPDEFGTSLSPNTATSLSVQVIFFYQFEYITLQFKLYFWKVNEIKRMKAPFQSKCMDSWDQTGYNISNAYSFPVICKYISKQ